MKRKGRFLLFVLLALALPKRAGADQWVFNKYIEIVCPWGIGGGADNTLRTIAPLLQGVLDTEVKIINVPGNGGIDGVQYVMEKTADAYCFLLGTQSMIMADLQGRMETRFKEEFVPVSRLVYSVDVIVASRAACEGRFQTFEEANREDCSKIPKARKAHKFSTFGRSLSIRTFAGHRHEPPYLLLYLKMKIIHEIGQAAFSYN